MGKKRFVQCVEKVLWVIEHVKSGLRSFLQISHWTILGQIEQLKLTVIKLKHWEQSALQHAGDSQHTQNIQINKLIGESEKCLLFYAKKLNGLFGQSSMKGSKHMVVSRFGLFVCFLLFLKLSNNYISWFIPFKTSLKFRFKFEMRKYGSFRAVSESYHRTVAFCNTTEGVRNYFISGLPTYFLLWTAVEVFSTVTLPQDAFLIPDG